MRKVTTIKGVELLVPEKGEKHAGAGRPKGSKNKITLGLKEAFLVALETVGEDGKGKKGLTGYLIKVARTRPDLIVRILGKLILLEAKVAAKAEKKRTYTKEEPAKPPRYETLEDIRAGIDYRLENAEINDLSFNATRSVRAEEGSSIISSVTPKLSRNTLNHAFDPTAGSFEELSLEIAGLGGTQFLKT